MSITTATRNRSSSVPAVTPRKPPLILDEADLAEGRALRAELAELHDQHPDVLNAVGTRAELDELRAQHQRALRVVEAARDAWLQGMRRKYPHRRALIAILSDTIGMHRTSVHAILSKGRNTRTRGGSS